MIRQIKLCTGIFGIQLKDTSFAIYITKITLQIYIIYKVKKINKKTCNYSKYWYNINNKLKNI